MIIEQPTDDGLSYRQGQGEVSLPITMVVFYWRQGFGGELMLVHVVLLTQTHNNNSRCCTRLSLFCSILAVQTSWRLFAIFVTLNSQACTAEENITVSECF